MYYLFCHLQLDLKDLGLLLVLYLESLGPYFRYLVFAAPSYIQQSDRSDLEKEVAAGGACFIFYPLIDWGSQGRWSN